MNYLASWVQGSNINVRLFEDDEPPADYGNGKKKYHVAKILEDYPVEEEFVRLLKEHDGIDMDISDVERYVSRLDNGVEFDLSEPFL